MNTIFKATAKKLPEGLQVETTVRNFKILLDEPEDLGGTNKGLNPVEAVLSALGACQTICAYAFAGAMHIDLKDFYVELEGDLDPDGFMGLNKEVRNGFSEVRFTMHMTTDASQKKAEKLADFIESRCPVGDCLENPVKLIRTGVVIHQE